MWRSPVALEPYMALGMGVCLGPGPVGWLESSLSPRRTGLPSELAVGAAGFVPFW